MFYAGGGGPTNLGDYLSAYLINTEGAGNVSYPSGRCLPPRLDISTVGDVVSGQTVTGNLCYEIASSDASTLMLSAAAKVGTIWFALH